MVYNFCPVCGAKTKYSRIYCQELCQGCGLTIRHDGSDVPNAVNCVCASCSHFHHFFPGEVVSPCSVPYEYDGRCHRYPGKVLVSASYVCGEYKA